MKIIRGMYDLSQAGILANKLLKEHLKPFGYYKVNHTPGLWRHQTLLFFFTLVVDDFGIHYIDNAHAQHLINTLKTRYELSIDQSGSLYCGVTLNWNYKQHYVNTSIPKYVPTEVRLLRPSKLLRPSFPIISKYPLTEERLLRPSKLVRVLL